MTANPPANSLERTSLALVTIYWIALFIGTHVPRVQPPQVLRHSDKWLHFAAFAVLAALVAWAWHQRAAFGWRQALVVLAVLALYGAMDELTQPYFGRFANRSDWYADLAGIVVGLAAFLAVARRLRRGR